GPERTCVAIVRAYLAHRQGMRIVAIANVLHDRAMRARFHAEPIVQATELLLQERTPRDVAVTRPRSEEVSGAADVRELVPAVVRRFSSPHASTPRTHLLSNGRYAVMMTAAGSGYSRFKGLAVTRWRDDVTRDSAGTYVFLRNVQTGETWSAGYQPTARAPDRYEVRFAEDRVEIVRRDRGIATTLEVIVSPEDDAEMRRVSLTNHGTRTREIDVTSYAEVVLAEPEADAAHPAFSNLFVRTEALPELDALLATRRARSPDEAHLFQSLAAHILYPQRTLRASADVLARHGEGPAALWAHGISGDTPIVLVRIDEVDDVEIVRQLLRAHEYWRMKQLAVDLV